MDSSSNPNELYQQWLEIPAEYCPPNHYALLGIDDFCDGNDAIDAAAKQRTAYLHQIAAGPNRKDVQRLLGEIAVARRILLNAESRQQYDQWLLTPDDETEDVGTSQALSFSIQLDSESKAAVSSNTARSSTSGRKASERTASRRKQRSNWDAYKLHLLSASVLACAVGIFAFVNRDGGRRASAIPQQQSEKTPAGQGFQRQTGLIAPANSSVQAKSGSAKPTGKNSTAQRKRSGLTLSGPAGFDEMTKSVSDPQKTVASLPRFDAPDTAAEKKPPNGKKITLPANWTDGLESLEAFTDKFHDQFTTSPGQKDSVRIENGKLIILRSKPGPLYPRFTSVDHQLAPGTAIGIDTSMRPSINAKATIGLFVGKRQFLLQSTAKGISIRTKLLAKTGKADSIYNLRPKGNSLVTTLVIARDKANNKALHWFLKSGNASCAGTVMTDMDETSAKMGLSVTCPNSAMNQELWVSNFRIGTFAKAPAWPK